RGKPAFRSSPPSAPRVVCQFDPPSLANSTRHSFASRSLSCSRRSRMAEASATPELCDEAAHWLEDQVAAGFLPAQLSEEALVEIAGILRAPRPLRTKKTAAASHPQRS